MNILFTWENSTVVELNQFLIVQYIMYITSSTADEGRSAG